MGYGIGRDLPNQDWELIRRLSLRWMRAASPHNRWAKKGKLCTDFLEGNQWSEEAKAELAAMKRSALTINKMNTLYRLVIGYQTSNRMDVNFMPTSDSRSSEDISKVLNAMFQAEAGRMDLKWTDSEVFSDGLITGRGWWDARLCFTDNDFGEIKIKSEDPFSIYVDPDCCTYDMNEDDGGAAYLQKSYWTSIDQVGDKYGIGAAEAVENLVSPAHTSQLLSFLGEQDISPERFFGQYADDKAMGNWADVYHTDFVDHQAKRLRLTESQYKITQIRQCFIDLETGERKPVPDEWMKPEEQYRIRAVLDHAANLGNEVVVKPRPVKSIRWTVTCADALLHDSWSPYESYTLIPFFPYFRRGTTRGMLEDLIDPQREVNKKRSVMTDILNRNANSGWIYESQTLDPEQEENLRRYGSAPGIAVKWTRSNPNSEAPRRLEPGNYPQGLDRLEEKNAIDLHEISGINESALGQLDRVQSGRAIEARQRQAVLSIQPYQDNFTRSKKVQGRKALEIFQNHYTEERIFRVIGEDSNMATYEINKKIMTGDNAISRMNDITIGKYSVNIDEIPISATFKQGQFEEMMMILEKLGPIGQAMAGTRPDLIIDQTSIPRKDEWKEALLGSAAALPPPGAPAAGGGMPVGPAAGTPEMMAS